MVLSKKMNTDIKNIINDNINTTNDLLNEVHCIEDICSLAPVYYTHLTLPTNREV